MKTSYKRRMLLMGGIFAFCLIFMAGRLGYLMIGQADKYLALAKDLHQREREIKAPRGNIYDRNGEMVASNILSYSLTFEDNGSYETTREKNLTLNGVAYRVLQILSENGDSLSGDFHIVLDENGNYAFDVGEGFTLSRFKADIYGHPLIDDLTKEQASATAGDMMNYLTGSDGFSIVLYGEDAYAPEELEQYGLPKELSKQEILDIASMRYKLNTNSFQKYMAVTIATNVSESTVAAVMENQSQLQGIDVIEDSVRQYIDDESMGPVLGYTGRASAEELETLKKENPDYSNDAVIGKAGIEQYMEQFLHGTDGQETVTVDNLGKVLKIDENTIVPPVAGDDVYLSIDSDWQSAIYQILKQRVAGVLLTRIENTKKFDFEGVKDASQISVPIYDVYNALVANSVIDIEKFNDQDASDTEKNLYAKFQQKQQEVFDTITNRLTGDNPPAYKDESEEVQEYLTYICDTVLRDTLGVISKDAVDTSDPTYLAWAEEESISLREYLNYAAGQNWIDISVISPKGEYLDSAEIYQAMTSYIVDYLKTDLGFSKLLYKYLLMNDQISGQDLCLVLYEQGVLSKEDEAYSRLASGELNSYDFMINKIANLEIEPAQLALKPCSASAVVTDVNTGKVVACVSYPGYDNNRLSNEMDTDYYTRLSLDLSSPFFNKATQQTTAPGSTLKLLSAVTGMMENLVDDSTYIECTGKFDLVNPPINCWNKSGHGSLEIRGAIEQSCNYYFNMIGFEAGKNEKDEFSENLSLSKLQKYAEEFGLDENTGIEISEATPHVSDSKAVPSYIGQGNHLYTTSQLARYATALATSGTVYDLSLLDKVTDSQGQTQKTYETVVKSEMTDVPSHVWEDIHDGMRRVVQTHEQFNGLGVALSGKTGTAEIDYRQPNHGLFIGYAPSDQPQYAIAVRIANGYSSGNACTTANDIMEYIFDLADKDTILTGYASTDVSNTSND